MRPGPCEEHPPRRGDTAAEAVHDDTSPSTARGSYAAIMTAAILGSAIAFIDGTIVAVALPSIREGLGASLDQMQWVVNGYALMLAAFILPAGSAGDVFGRRRVFLIGVAIYTAASLWCGLARSAPELILARTVEGVGGAFMIPASLALITVNVPREKRGRAIGLWAAAGAASTAIGPLAGGAIVDGFGWRVALLLTVPIGVVTFVVARAGVPESKAEGGAMDWSGGLLACLGLGALAYGLTVIGGAPVWLVTASVLAGLAGIAAFVWHQTGTATPMMPLELFRRRAFSGANALTFLLYAALGGFLFFLPMTLIDGQGYSATTAGLVLLPFTVVIGLLSRLVGGLTDRLGARLPLTVGPTVAAIGFAALTLAVRDGGMVYVLGAACLMGVGMGITVAPLSTTVMNAVEDERAGVASGTNNAISRAAGLIAVAALGPLAQWGYAASGADGAFGEAGEAAATLAGFTAIGVTCAGLAGLAAVTGFLSLRADDAQSDEDGDEEAQPAS